MNGPNLKKQILVAALVLAAVFSAPAAEPAPPAAGAPRIKLAQATVNAPLPAGVPFDVNSNAVSGTDAREISNTDTSVKTYSVIKESEIKGEIL